MRQIVLDTETTGLSPARGDRLIEIGCVEMIDRRLTGDYLHLYVNPERTVSVESIEIHGITDDFLADKPTFKMVAKQIVDYIKDAELVIHNAAFDIRFLNYELRYYSGEETFGEVTDYSTVLDTLTMARQQHPGQRNSLDALCKRYDINNQHRQLHGALLDAQILGQVYLAMTGGQHVLSFADEPAMDPDSRLIHQIDRISRDGLSLPVQMASDEELLAHKQYMQKLQDMSTTPIAQS